LISLLSTPVETLAIVLQAFGMLLFVINFLMPLIDDLGLKI